MILNPHFLYDIAELCIQIKNNRNIKGFIYDDKKYYLDKSKDNSFIFVNDPNGYINCSLYFAVQLDDTSKKILWTTYNQRVRLSTRYGPADTDITLESFHTPVS